MNDSQGKRSVRASLSAAQAVGIAALLHGADEKSDYAVEPYAEIYDNDIRASDWICVVINIVRDDDREERVEVFVDERGRAWIWVGDDPDVVAVAEDFRRAGLVLPEGEFHAFHPVDVDA